MQAQAKKIEIITDIDVTIPQKIQFDKERMQQILRIFVSNALKFTLQGSITILVHYNSAASWLEFEIKDTGVGILQSNQTILFQPFSQIQETRYLNKNGVGLNLFIAKLLCSKLKGKVSVQSRKGSGSSFTFSIEASLEEH